MTAASKSGAFQRQLRAELCRRSFVEFVRYFWPHVTGRELQENHAIRAVCCALQAVAEGRIVRLIIAMPPGVGKSTLLALYAAWRLARDPGHRAIHAAHSSALATTESRRVRRLVEGDAYLALYPAVRLRVDEAAIDAWATDAGGIYLAVGTGVGLTGRRAVEAVLDDPLAATDRFSKAARDGLWAWFGESLETRLDGDLAPIIVVSQRLDPDDLAGRILASPDAASWTVLELAAEFDSARRCSIPGIWTDPRTEEGELLAPGPLSREKLAGLKLSIGSAAFATQYQQNPIDDSSSDCPRSWWRFHYTDRALANAPRPAGCDTEMPAVPLPEYFDAIVISVDLTFGAKKGDFAVATVWASSGGARFLLDMWRARAGFEEALQALEMLAAKYPTARLAIEAAANGHATLEVLRRTLPNVTKLKPLGSKAQRLAAALPSIESGACHLPLGASWLEHFVAEMAGVGPHDDIQDATAYGLVALVTARALPEAEGGCAIDEFATYDAAAQLASMSETERDEVLRLAALL